MFTFELKGDFWRTWRVTYHPTSVTAKSKNGTYRQTPDEGSARIKAKREKSSLDIGWNVAGIKHVAYVVISIKCWKNNMTRPTTTSSLMSLFICLDDPSIYVFPGAKKKSAPFDEWLAPAFKMSVVLFPTNAGVAYTKMPWKNVIPKS